VCDRAEHAQQQDARQAGAPSAKRIRLRRGDHRDIGKHTDGSLYYPAGNRGARQPWRAAALSL